MGVPNFYSWLMRRFPLCLYEHTRAQRVDYFYLDMNQIIYKCATDPTVLFKDQLRERDFDDIWVSILNYLDMIINLVNPQQLLFLAFDGVAPRAKMNQQRQRRFQSQKRYKYLSAHLQQIGLFQKNETYKNNQFSPGTEFMTQLNQQIKFYIERKYSEDPKFKNLKIIFSGCDVPGEGEHKLLSFIRNLQCDPNSVHMIYGADADLIMLGLLTQLKNVLIIREDLKFKQTASAAANRVVKIPEFLVINISIVREYLDLEFAVLKDKMKVPYDINRIIDDFILLCFFVGNDFLPRIFCFDIRIGTIEPLVDLFKNHLTNANDYLVHRGDINYKELISLLDLLQGFEKLCINDRQQEMLNYLNTKHQNRQVIAKEKELIDNILKYFSLQEQTEGRKFYYKAKCQITKDDELDLDKLGDMCVNYMEGIYFVLQYYFKGVPSWEWYYKYYYAPLCGDLVGVVSNMVKQLQDKEEPILLTKGEPYPPFKQLLSILTPENAQLLPEPYGRLLTDKENSILRTPIDYYPENFETDSYGTMYEHQHITKIPFLDCKIVEEAYNSVPDTQDKRNQQAQSIFYQYDSSQQQIYESTLPKHFSNFKSCCKKQFIDIDDKEQCQIACGQQQIMEQFENTFQIPTLQVVNIKSSKLVNIQMHEDDMKKFENQYLLLELQSAKFDFDQFIQDVIKNKNFVYCGFPIQQQCEVLAILRPDHLNLLEGVKLASVQLLKDYSKKDHSKIYKEIRNKTLNQYEKFMKLDCTIFLIVKQYKHYIRDNNNQLSYPQEQYRELVYPYEFVFTDHKIKYIIPNFEDFQIDRQVVIFHEKQNGANGIIKQIDQKLTVQITASPTLLGYDYIHSDIYYSLQIVSEKLQCSVKTLLNLLGSVVVNMEDKESKIADQLDIGLNIINRTNNQLVPELVRLPQADQYATGSSKYQKFKDLELSEKCVTILCKYRNQCSRVQQYLNQLNDSQRNCPINAKDLFPNSTDPNIDLLKIYIWILQLPESQYLLQGSSSKVAEIMVHKKPIQNNNINTMEKVDPGFAVQQTTQTFLPPFFIKHPTIHKIGDRVVNLNYPFGIYGTVVGLLEQKEIMVQVLWDQKYIGFTNLGGRYDLLSCSNCKFTDIFNLSSEDWRLNLAKKGCHKGEFWDLWTKVYKPDFKSRAIECHDQLKEQNPFKQLVELPVETRPKVLVKDKDAPQGLELLQKLVQEQPNLITNQPLQGIKEENIDQNEDEAQKEIKKLFQLQQQIDLQSQVEQLKQTQKQTNGEDQNVQSQQIEEKEEKQNPQQQIKQQAQPQQVKKVLTKKKDQQQVQQ
ncbi:unnamed protein product (macronuclear) [Paramecium tetraurelia]|uniref:Uncharacterized protein n=1 Tax=Paramecium tetraurelia TaxID=5888 RepID=A0CZ91_PARTE|nr:uncharacterized protein GSPATT00011681001 [Paramecium tetraurelia]CAK76108.1 unnamed protein product [Paramecium tetraurelia]|eukprot:XP_001443505.1 hypothetical protein (macronuclear) [Paramecium tetraurelia strain d4-2]